MHFSELFFVICITNFNDLFKTKKMEMSCDGDIDFSDRLRTGSGANDK